MTRVIDVDISRLRQIDGFLGGWLIDSESGFVVASECGLDEQTLQIMLSASIGMARANFRALKDLQLDEGVDDIVVSLGRQVHLICPLEQAPKVYLCVALDKNAANPGLALLQVKRVGQSVRL